MKLIVTPQAAQELREIEEYIGKDNPKAAMEFVGRLTERFYGLVGFPGIGRKRDDIKAGYRSVAEGEHVILYRLSPNDVIEIMRVLHGNPDLGKALKD